MGKKRSVGPAEQVFFLGLKYETDSNLHTGDGVYIFCLILQVKFAEHVFYLNYQDELKKKKKQVQKQSQIRQANI